MHEHKIETCIGGGTTVRLDMRAAFLFGTGRYLYAFYNANTIDSFYHVGRMCTLTNTWSRLTERGIFIPYGTFVLPFAKHDRGALGREKRAFLLFTPSQGVNVVSLDEGDGVHVLNEPQFIPVDTMLSQPEPAGLAGGAEAPPPAPHPFPLFIKWIAAAVECAHEFIFIQAEVALSRAGLLRNTAIFCLHLATKRWTKLAIEETETRKMPVGAAMALHAGHLYLFVRKKNVSSVRGTMPHYGVKEVVGVSSCLLFFFV